MSKLLKKCTLKGSRAGDSSWGQDWGNKHLESVSGTFLLPHPPPNLKSHPRLVTLLTFPL